MQKTGPSGEHANSPWGYGARGFPDQL